jgi:hypothetical protein
VSFFKLFLTGCLQRALEDLKPIALGFLLTITPAVLAGIFILLVLPTGILKKE